MTENTITLNPDTIKEFNELLEDAVEYICGESFKEGEPLSGETLYKVMECFAQAKQAQFAGLCD